MVHILDRKPYAISLSTPQREMEALLSHAVSEAGNVNNALPVFLGGAAFRITRCGILAAGSSLTGNAALLLRGASYGLALAGEASVYELSHRSLQSFQTLPNPSLWKWEGEQGLKNGFFSSLINFGFLHSAGHVAQGENIVFQHFFQDAATLAGQEVASHIGFIARPVGSFSERMVKIEFTNLQMMAGMSFYHQMFPAFGAHERFLEALSDSQIRALSFTKPPFLTSLQLAFAASRASLEAKEINPNLVLSRMEDEFKEGGGGSPLPSTLEMEREASRLLDWYEPQAKTEVEKQTIRLLRKDLQVLKNPLKHPKTYEKAYARIEILEGLRRLQGRYALDGFILEQLKKHSGIWLASGNHPYEQYRYSPDHHLPRSLEYSEPMLSPKAYLDAAFAQSLLALEQGLTREEILAKKVDENALNCLWFYQLILFAQEVGARVSLRPASSLLSDFQPGKDSLDPASLSAAEKALRAKGLEGQAFDVIEMAIPFGELVFGREKGSVGQAYFSKFIYEMERALGGAVKLIDRSAVLEAPIILRIPSASMMEALLHQRYPGNAPSFFYAHGEIPQDVMMKARKLGVAVIGMVPQPFIFGDVNVRVPPWIFSIHDMFHAYISAPLTASFRSFVALQYEGVQGNAWGARREAQDYLNQLVDLNFPEAEFFIRSFSFLEGNLRNKLAEGCLQEKDFRDNLRFLAQYQEWMYAQKATDEGNLKYYPELERSIEYWKSRVEKLRRIYQYAGRLGLKVYFFSKQ